MATTKDEATKDQKAQEEVITARSVTRADVRAEYEKGKNYYQLAQEFFGFESEEALERIRQIVEG